MAYVKTIPSGKGLYLQYIIGNTRRGACQMMLSCRSWKHSFVNLGTSIISFP
jgi:hypothetical protein